MIALLIMVPFMPVIADSRDENIDVFIVLDKSLSMEEEIAAVRQYVKESLVDRLLIEGDRVTIIAFFGKAVRLVSERVATDRSSLHSKVASLEADGRYTDIGNALDALDAAVKSVTASEMRKYLLLLTDGIQEAPPDSKYYSPDGSFNHAFLTNTKSIQREGWKILILGIGAATDARRMAEELSATYAEVAAVTPPEDSTTTSRSGDGGTMSAETAGSVADRPGTDQPVESADSDDSLSDRLSEATDGFLGRVDLVSIPEVLKIDSMGIGKVTVVLESFGYDAGVTVDIERVGIEYADGRIEDVLFEGVSIDVPKDGSIEERIPLRIESPRDPGEYAAEIVFSFTDTGEARFSPSRIPIRLEIRESIDKIWIFAGIALILILVVSVILLLLSRNRGKDSEGTSETV